MNLSHALLEILVPPGGSKTILTIILYLFILNSPPGSRGREVKTFQPKKIIFLMFLYFSVTWLTWVQCSIVQHDSHAEEGQCTTIMG